MRESDAPPPGDPATRGSGVWAGIIIGVILLFILWFVLRNREVREPGPGTTIPTVQQSG